jgi:hypothetical protein
MTAGTLGNLSPLGISADAGLEQARREYREYRPTPSFLVGTAFTARRLSAIPLPEG